MKYLDNLIKFFVGKQVKTPISLQDKSLNSLIDMPGEAEILSGLANILSDGYITPEEENSLSILVECAKGNPALYAKMVEAICASHISEHSIANLLGRGVIPCRHINIPKTIKKKVTDSHSEVKERLIRHFQYSNSLLKIQSKVQL